MSLTIVLVSVLRKYRLFLFAVEDNYPINRSFEFIDLDAMSTVVTTLALRLFLHQSWYQCPEFLYERIL
jgi:hypothetical protein